MIGGKIYQDILDFKKLKKNSKYYNNFFYNGRYAFHSILNEIKKKKIKKIYVPNYICSSLIEAIPKNFKIFFYDIDNKLDIIDFSCKDCVILVIDFFGKKAKLNNSILKNNFIIYDKTFSYNPKCLKLDKNFFFSSPRKLFPSAVCSITNIKNKKALVSNLELLDIYKKCVAGSFLRESYNKNYYYNKSIKIENFFLKEMSRLETFFYTNFSNYKVESFFKNYFFKINFDKKYSILKKNKKKINNGLRKVKNIKILDNKNILFSLFFSDKKEHLIKLLKKNSIFISNYWSRPKILQHKILSHNLYEDLILLPNNSYLTGNEINRMHKIINSFYEKNKI